jgi:hypothetical protein
MEIFTIKNWRTGEIIHEGEAESFKEFVEANKACLEGASLEDADLKGADLGGASLKGADLKGADLGGASLKGADLKGADLKDADLKGANLEKAKIQIHSKRVFLIEVPDLHEKNLDIGEVNIAIGCKTKTISEWDEWFAGTEEFETPRHSFEFKQIEAHYEGVKSYLLKLYKRN